MDPITASLTTTAVAEGVKFLYAQAGEILGAWRKRRRHPDAAAPQVLPPPGGITVVSQGEPIADAPDRETEDVLQDLLDAVAPVRDGEVPVESEEARAAVGELRGYVEQLLRASIAFDGEAARTLEVRDVAVVARDVDQDVTGVAASLEKLAEQTRIDKVRVDAQGVKENVTGVDLT